MSIIGLVCLFFALAALLLVILYAFQRRELRALQGLSPTMALRRECASQPVA